MKIHRILALVVVALLVVTMSSVAMTRALAQTPGTDTTEDSVSGPDTDNVEEQVGDQSDQDDGTPEAETKGNEADESAKLASQAVISPDQASATALAANPGASVAKVELDDENGSVVYSVELTNGTDVKVNAVDGTIVATETGTDGED